MTRGWGDRVDRPHLQTVRTAERGMTLVEILVVLAIIAITASVAVLSIGSDSNLRGRAEARRVEARLQLAADQMMVGDRPVAMAVAERSYAFLERDERSGKWRPLDDRVLGEPFDLPEGMKLAVGSGEMIFPLGADGAGRPFSLTLEWKGGESMIAFDGMTARLRGAATGVEPGLNGKSPT